MQRKITFAPGEFYHIYNRGVEKRTIYKAKSDYMRFLCLLYLCNGTAEVNIREQFPKGLSFGELRLFERGAALVDICAYCVMPNHFHVLIRACSDNGISIFLKKLCTAYSMYFNRKYGRTGKLFENVYKATHVDQDEYLKYLLAYIHLNPIKIINPTWKEDGISDLARAKLFLEEYAPTSYKDYLKEERPEGIILNKDAMPDYFDAHDTFESFINSWLSVPKDSPLGLSVR